ncbi:MFS general substrate transporter [Auriculariales sp. MPI-PUGE-AT-0066]|nr:MFS general substrate transporter [Auriculariales sp. MPI-PUGE-AT-0066]
MARSSSSSPYRARHDVPTPLPWGQLSLLYIIQLAEPVTSTVIYPFIAQLVIELGVTHDPAKTGYYAGLIESLFFLTEAACVLHWGQLSDRIGRRPVLMLGLFGLALSQICFGIASGRHGSFVAVIVARALAGALNGNVGVNKSAVGELTDETNAAKALALMPIIWNAGSSIGLLQSPFLLLAGSAATAAALTLTPLLGGGLAHPYERFPGSIFAKYEFFKEYPYILPCGAAALFSLFACAVTATWFRETSEPSDEDFPPYGSSSPPVPSDIEGLTTPAPPATPIHPAFKHAAMPFGEHSRTPTVQFSAPHTPTGERTPLLEHQRAASTGSIGRSASRLSMREIMTPRLRAALVAYSLLAITEISYLALQPLYLSSPTGAGGLGLSASTIGLWMGGAGALNAVVQAFAYPRLHARWGEKRLFIVGALAFVLLWPFWICSWVLAARLDSTTTDVDAHWSTAPSANVKWVWALLSGSFVLYMISQFCYAGIFQFVNNAAPRRALGAANGLAQTCTSSMRAIGPAALTSLWSWSAGWLHRTHAHHVDVGAGVGVGAHVYPIDVGGVAVPWQAMSVYVAMEVFSVALVWAGTGLIEGRCPESRPGTRRASKPGSRVRTPIQGGPAS